MPEKKHSLGNYVGKAIEVIDASTIKFTPKDGNHEEWILKINGIETPVRKHGNIWPDAPFTYEASEFVEELILGKNILINLVEDDGYHRRHALVYHFDEEEEDWQNLAVTLIRNGYATIYENKKKNVNYYDTLPEMKKARTYARKNKIRLYSVKPAFSARQFKEVHKYLYETWKVDKDEDN